MARPVGADPEKTRRRLVAAGVGELTQHGWEATSLRRVAAAAGVSLASIHYHFRTKQVLYDACVEALYGDLERAIAPLGQMLGELTRRVAQAPLEAEELATLVGDLVRQAFRFILDQRPVLQLVMRPLLTTGELEPRWRDTTLLPFVGRTSELLADLTGRPREALRLGLQSVVALGVRYALSSPRELAMMAGLATADTVVDSATGARAAALVEDHLVDIAQRLLLPATTRL